MGISSSVVSLKRHSCLGGPFLVIAVNQVVGYPGWAFQIKRQASFSGHGLISGVNSRQASLGGPVLIHDVNHQVIYPGWAWPNQWCGSNLSLA